MKKLHLIFPPDAWVTGKNLVAYRGDESPNDKSKAAVS